MYFTKAKDYKELVVQHIQANVTQLLTSNWTDCTLQTCITTLKEMKVILKYRGLSNSERNAIFDSFTKLNELYLERHHKVAATIKSYNFSFYISLSFTTPHVKHGTHQQQE